MSRSLVSAFTPSLYSIDSIWKPSSVSHIRQFQMSHEHKRSRTDLNLIPFSSSNPGSSTNSSEALMAALTDTILPVQSESESEIESKIGQSTIKSVTNSSVLRSIISSILNSKENSQSEKNLPSKVLIEEALCLLDSLQSSAEKEATNAYNFKQKNSSNKQVCNNTLGESVIEKSNSLDVIRNDSIMTLLSQKSLSAVHSLRKMMLNFGPSKSKGRKALMSTLSNIITNQNPSKVLAITCLVSALCLYDSSDERSFSEDDHRSLSRAVVSGLLPNGRYDNEKKKKQKKIEQSKNDELDIDSQVFANSFGSHAVLALLKIAKGDTHNIKIDLHIVTGLSRAFISDYTPEIKKMASDVIREKLYIYNDADMLENDNFVLPSNVISVKKVQVTGALGLAAEIGPFCQMSPITLVYLSVEMNLWHAAERICDSAILNNSLETHEAVHALIDSASTRHLFRQSDTYATYFYDNGGRSRYTEARFKHACDTISKVVLKRHYPIVEKQVERVDKAFERVQNDKSKFEEQDDEQEVEEEKENNRNGPQEIREFALKRVIDVGDQETAHRFSSLWNIGFLYNEEEIEKYAQSRREKYIQWDDVFSDSSSSVDAIPVPDLIDDPDEMINSFRVLESTVNKKNPVIGFDVEWGDEGDGAALLQLSTMKKAILIDIPALSTTVEGCNSLECTVGKLFAGQGSTTVAAGFSCKQDLSRLHASPSVTETHWFHGTSAFIDIKPMIGNSIPKLKLLGLSRICKHYLGKPLDKSEQCSLWTNRPLSLSQRAYAALDAWAVVAIYQKLPPIKLS